MIAYTRLAPFAAIALILVGAFFALVGFTAPSSATGHYKMYMGGLGLIIGGLFIGILGEISKNLAKSVDRRADHFPATKE